MRLLIVDAPETTKRVKKLNLLQMKRKKRTEELLTNVRKSKSFGDVGDHADKYDRALMYVYVDGKLLQDILIEEGLPELGNAYRTKHEPC